jgi:cytochrome d ubiquinol oxidase subunit I
MQHPVGYVIRNGRAELADFWAVVTQGFAAQTFFHTVTAAYIVGGFFVMGVSAYHLLRRQEVNFFTKSFQIALVFSLIFSVAELVQGHHHGSEVAKIQPAKLAAMESFWETRANAPQVLFLLPDVKNERNSLEIGAIPGALSMLAYHSPTAVVKGLKDFPQEDRPPVLPVFLSFRLMVGLGFLFVLLTGIGWFKRKKLVDSPGYLKIMLYAIPLPYIACQAGWIVTEIGRQPWIVYGMMKTADAVSPIAASQVGTTLVGFILLYSLLGATAFYLMTKIVREGPEPAAVSAAPEGGQSNA